MKRRRRLHKRKNPDLRIVIVVLAAEMAVLSAVVLSFR